MVLLSFGSTIEQTVHAQMMQAKELIEQFPFGGFIETVPAYNSLAVYYNPAQVKKTEETISASVIDQLKNILQQQPTKVDAIENKTVITIPVCYDEEAGIDLQELSTSLQLSTEEIIQLHTEKTYHVFMIGFTPGFPYMGTVDKQLITNRKTKPRLNVPPGSVAIAGNQTGIYPFATPGGWNIIGRTPLQLFDRNKTNPFLLKAGDEVKFKSITKDEFEKYDASDVLAERNSTNIINRPTKASHKQKQILTIEQCGFLTTLQDAGRQGALQFGVSKSGAMDVYAARLANTLIGNDEGEALLEITQSPHRFHFLQDAVVAFTGAGLQPQSENSIIQRNQPVFISKGSVIECKQPIAGFRLYMAVTGGFEADKFLDSFSTDLLVKAGGHQGRTLMKHDELGTRRPISPLQKRLATVLKAGAIVEINTMLPDYSATMIRILKGVEWDYLQDASKINFTQESFTISPQSSRMGFRLKGEGLSTTQACEIISSPVTQGTIQLTASGELIVLMADAQTVGGYPRIANVCAVDLPILAQKKPGDQIHFQLISLQEAEELYLKQLEEVNRVKEIMYSKLA